MFLIFQRLCNTDNVAMAFSDRLFPPGNKWQPESFNSELWLSNLSTLLFHWVKLQMESFILLSWDVINHSYFICLSPLIFFFAVISITVLTGWRIDSIKKTASFWFQRGKKINSNVRTDIWDFNQEVITTSIRRSSERSI